MAKWKVMAVNFQYLLSSLFVRKITLQDKYLCASLKEPIPSEIYFAEKSTAQ